MEGGQELRLFRFNVLCMTVTILTQKRNKTYINEQVLAIRLNNDKQLLQFLFPNTYSTLITCVNISS